MCLHPFSHKQSAAQWGGGARPVSRSPGPSPLAWWVAPACASQPASQELPGFTRLPLPWLKGGREAPTPPCRSVTGTKWCLPSGVLTCEQAESQDTSEPIWRMGRQLSSVSGPVDLEDHLFLHTHSHLAGDLVWNQGCAVQNCTKMISHDILAYIHTVTKAVPDVMFPLRHVMQSWCFLVKVTAKKTKWSLNSRQI